ncbi:ABC transporter substrate-binding protein [Rhodococcus sp. IEGM 1381]|uniref:ABC transporter substrate-binding protein n=1 Tax=Rhodococcus sp. IEGM 1381 TaxID=3047085 RepID=UPI0024B6B5B0|nr:ABC transporter substrate-binding protein [Rhodococcus sp. IEGM 1381]MDI9897412.1 ABC transporter substrate-binding protein [Rhodococcus sp. IEGM 1381]
MRTSRTLATGAAALALSLMATACGGSTDAAEDGPLVLGVIAEQTGPVPVLGLVVNGMEAAVDDVNKNGGINGRQVQLDVRDSAGDPAKAVGILRAFDESGISMVLGGAFGASCAAEGPAAERLDLVALCLSTDPLPDETSRMFGVGSPYDVTVQAYSEELSKYGNRIGVFAEKAQSGDDIDRLVPPAFAEKGVDAVIERTDPEATSYKASIQRVIAQGVDALWFTQCTPTVLAGVADAKALGFTGNIMLMNCLSSDDIAAGLVNDAAKPGGQIVNLLPSLFDPKSSANPQQRAAVDEYLKVVGTRDAVLAAGWDSVWIAKQAYEAADGTGGDNLQAALQNNFTFEGVWQRGVWTEDDHRGNDGVGMHVPVVVGSDGTWQPK